MSVSFRQKGFLHETCRVKPVAKAPRVNRRIGGLETRFDPMRSWLRLMGNQEKKQRGHGIGCTDIPTVALQHIIHRDKRHEPLIPRGDFNSCQTLERFTTHFHTLLRFITSKNVLQRFATPYIYLQHLATLNNVLQYLAMIRTV